MAIIAIDGGNYVTGQPVKSGINRLVNSFINNIPDEGNTVINYYYFGATAMPSSPHQHLHKLPQKFFGTISLPFYTLKDRNTAFIAFSGYIPKPLQLFPIKKIGIVHDLGFFKYPELYRNPYRLQQDMKELIKTSSVLVVFSDYVAEDVRKYFANTTVPVHRIYAGVDHIFTPSVLKKALQEPESKKYFLYVGVLKPIKNIEYLLERYAAFRNKKNSDHTQLILIGEKESSYFEQLQMNMSYQKYKKDISFIERVTDEELTRYYLGATAVINVSREEGFCYPVLEAAALEKTVIVNNLPLYKEYTPYFDSIHIANSRQAVVAALEHAAKSKVTIPTLKKHLPQEFTWANFTHKLLALI